MVRPEANTNRRCCIVYVSSWKIVATANYLVLGFHNSPITHPGVITSRKRKSMHGREHGMSQCRTDESINITVDSEDGCMSPALCILPPPSAPPSVNVLSPYYSEGGSERYGSDDSDYVAEKCVEVSTQSGWNLHKIADIAREFDPSAWHPEDTQMYD